MIKKGDYIKLAVLFLLVVIAYIPTFSWMYIRWTVRDTYYSHGFLIPFISLFLIWQRRSELSKIKIQPSSQGWILFISAIVVHVLCVRFRVSFLSGFSLIFTLMGLVLLSLGKEYLKKVLFSVIFLAFMIPLPEVAIANLSFRLKIFAAQIATFVIRAFGVVAIREGSVIRTAHSYIMVEDPCSGIRSLVALIALGALMAYFSNISKTKKVILFISSVPIAIATNVVRIVALSLASEMYGTKLALGLFHNIMGVLVFVLAFFGLVLIGKILE
ncbi:MAG: exosortase/archaeosortase family protein [Candidatus Omnitrophota bacterium]|nr:exosortase/archaeosortase family protein [Candidatus Omnitrophota bacterium]